MSAIAEGMAKPIAKRRRSLIAILAISDLWLLTKGTVAHPVAESLVAQRIDNFKSLNQPWIEIDSFGTPVSHGCVNLPLDKAQWLFDWTAIGTAVVIHD